MKKPKLTNHVNPTLLNYLFTTQARWYWITIIFVIITMISVLAIPVNSFPFVYVRYVFALIFVMGVPGYSFIKALFPKDYPVPNRSTELDYMERIALSVGMSVALTSIAGIILSFSPWGLQLVSITIILITLTIVFSTIALIREYKLAL